MNNGIGERGAEFRPRLSGVVARDAQLARQLNVVYRELMRSVGTLCERREASEGDAECRALMEELSFSALGEAVLLGELISALRCQRHARGGDARAESEREVRARIECYEALMGCTGDRVVRSVLSKLITHARRSLSQIKRMSDT